MKQANVDEAPALEDARCSARSSVTRLLDRDAVIDKLIYAAINPVKDQLVDGVASRCE